MKNDCHDANATSSATEQESVPPQEGKRKGIKKGITARKSDQGTGRMIRKIKGHGPEKENVQDRDQGIAKSVVQGRKMIKMIIVDPETEKNVDPDQEIEKIIDHDPEIEMVENPDQETEMAAEDHVQEIVVISTEEIESDLDLRITKLLHHLVIIIKDILVDNHEQCTCHIKTILFKDIL